jgi:hypothetical protein
MVRSCGSDGGLSGCEVITILICLAMELSQHSRRGTEENEVFQP